MERVVVTGGSGKVGRYVVERLQNDGWSVLNADLRRPAGRADEAFLSTDLTKLGQTIETFNGANAVVHLAAIPAPGVQTDSATFIANTESTYNVFQAAQILGIRRVVWASSTLTLGLPFIRDRPAFAPLDESHPVLAESGYALSKVVIEEMARQFARRTDATIIGLRFALVILPADYSVIVPPFLASAGAAKGHMWAYVDPRDAAACCSLALSADVSGARIYNVTAADTLAAIPSRELMEQVFPDVPIRDLGPQYASLVSIERAVGELGYQPRHSWRDEINAAK